MLWTSRVRPVVGFVGAALGGVLLAIAALWLFYRSGSPLVAPEVSIRGGDFRIIAGEGSRTPDTLEIKGVNSQGMAMVQGVIQPLEAGRYRYLSWNVDGLDTGQEFQLAWSTADSPRSLRYLTLANAASGRGVLDLDEAPQWRGRIVAVGFVMQGPVADPIRIHALELRPRVVTPAVVVSALMDEWSQVDDWTGTAINFNRGSPKNALFPPAVIVAVWIAFSMALYALVNPPWRGARSIAPYAALVLLGWLSLDLLWQKDLVYRLRQTAEQYAGMDERERQLAGPDRRLYQFLETARSHLVRSPSRIFILSARPQSSSVGRARYHLLPENVSMGVADLPRRDHVRPGDYLLLLSPMPRVAFDRERGILTSGGLASDNGGLSVELVYETQGIGRLFRMTGGD